MDFFVATFLKMYFVMTPFFVLSVFLTVTHEASLEEKRHLAVRVTFSVLVISLVLMYFGKYIFAIFGVTLDAFRIGAGALLFMSAVGLVNGAKESQKLADYRLSELAVVPLALPITVGPATIGVLLVMAADNDSVGEFVLESSAMTCSVLAIGMMLYFSNFIEQFIGKQGLSIVSKITGIILAALSAQIMFTGIRDFLGLA
ncbi:MAG: MarC family protein [Pseudomonadales bacterium]|nr:MarC family protein [Pseudomonadales bacterium]MCP5356778.1 MarC family protein [Pseudomonadales bacterium]